MVRLAGLDGVCWWWSSSSSTALSQEKKESFCDFVHVYLLFKNFWVWFLSPPKGFVCCIPEDGFFVSRLLIFSPQKQERIPDPSLLQGIQSYLGDEGRGLCAL
jgi:hypothetical protein